MKIKKLMVEEYTNGSMAIWCKKQKVKFRQIIVKPEKLPKPLPELKRRKASKPAKDHPWRGLFFVSKKMKIKAA